MFVTLYTDYNALPVSNSKSLGHRLICQRYDITDKLSPGENVIAFMLGEGYYHCDPSSLPYALFPVYGDVKLCFNIELVSENGEVINITSDTDMKWSPSFITECGAFVQGETHDYSL